MGSAMDNYKPWLKHLEVKTPILPQHLNRMSYIICIVGKSRSGKDTLANYLEGRKLKFADPAKRMLESWYGLLPGDMEKPEVRDRLVPSSTTTTYLDILIKSYHFWLSVDPLAPKYPTIREIEKTLAEGTPVILTDVRMTQEVQYVVDLPYPLYAIRVNRPGCPDVSSDESLEDNWESLSIAANAYFEFDNTGSIADLVDCAMELQADINNDLYYLELADTSKSYLEYQQAVSQWQPFRLKTPQI